MAAYCLKLMALICKELIKIKYTRNLLYMRIYLITTRKDILGLYLTYFISDFT